MNNRGDYSSRQYFTKRMERMRKDPHKSSRQTCDQEYCTLVATAAPITTIAAVLKLLGSGFDTQKINDIVELWCFLWCIEDGVKKNSLIDSSLEDDSYFLKVLCWQSYLKFISNICQMYRIMHVRKWRTVNALMRGLFWCLFPEVHSNMGNKHQRNTQASASTVHHESTYMNLFLKLHNITNP